MIMVGSQYDTEEEIKAKRETRRLKKLKKRQELISQGLDPDFPAECQFIERPMLYIPHEQEVCGCPLSVMTYNCLAQTLIRRDMFPESGPALKWYMRSKVLLHEIKYYNADVCCLQEIDSVQYELFWAVELPKYGYNTLFHHEESKSHGVMIIWKEVLFACKAHLDIYFDQIYCDLVKPRTRTNNVGLLVALEFKDNFLKRRKSGTMEPSRKGIVIGTFHLFWHPFGTFDRTRQCYIIKREIQQFTGTLGSETSWYQIFTGDFNSQPDSVPYLTLTELPIVLTKKQRAVIECSTAYKYSERRNYGKEFAMEEDDTGGKKNGEDNNTTEYSETPQPEKFDPTVEQRKLVDDLIDLHNEVDFQATSLYGLGYHSVHPANSDATSKEPSLSSWSTKWAGLLDYIFFVNHKPKSKYNSIEDFETDNDVRITGYLRMPTKEEMPNHSQPFKNEYPSDHISMMCKLELT
ncbi:putative RNA exonuclease NGL3 [Nakaseomyces bracarensis]|uniref:RNA exonuclease NGL3 n=1 Tax=Nakaseomyces bracarensis TaxID=273131 RepID=A0ABR4NXN6_9SACH